MPTKQKTARGKTLADLADRHHLYQLAVQCVEAEIDMVDATYKRIRGRRAKVLREDFCGTGNTSCEWVRRRKTNSAIGVDINAEVLRWGRRHNIAKLNAHQRGRIQLRQRDVLKSGDLQADIVLAMNFSYMLLKTRDQLRAYFAQVHKGLADDGIFMLDNYGGHDSWRTVKEKTKFKSDGFTYVWEHKKFNPITFAAICAIHFRFPDKSKIKNAFRYDWRMWTLPEIRETLLEAGFKNPTVYWEGTDAETGEGNDIFLPAEVGDDDPSWVVYISAEK